MDREAEKVKERENHRASRESFHQADSNKINDINEYQATVSESDVEQDTDSEGSNKINDINEYQATVSESDVEQDTDSEQTISLDYDINKDGTVDLSFEFRKRYDIASKLGRVGGLLVTAGILIVIIAPILYAINIIPTLSLLLAVMTSPFGVGAGLITLSEKFEYFPGV